MAMAFESDVGIRRRRSLWKGPALLTALILPIPIVGSIVIADWHWPPGAFVVLGGILFSIGFAYQLVTLGRNDLRYRMAVGMTFAACFVLVWSSFVQMADVVPAAALYFCVPIVGLVGAVLARLRPAGMARALLATALAQALALVAVLAFLMERTPRITAWTPPEWRGVGGNAFLVLIFAFSAWLFRQVARDPSSPSK
jgi:hypothetical protein